MSVTNELALGSMMISLLIIITVHAIRWQHVIARGRTGVSDSTSHFITIHMVIIALSITYTSGNEVLMYTLSDNANSHAIVT